MVQNYFFLSQKQLEYTKFMSIYITLLKIEILKLSGLKKNRFDYKLFKVFGIRQDEISLENSEFIEKMTRMNMLYSWTDRTNKQNLKIIINVLISLIHSFTIFLRKILAEKVKKLTNYDESQLSILKNIGKGTFGEVFEGVLQVNDTVHFSVAIKVLVNSLDHFKYFKTNLFLM